MNLIEIFTNSDNEDISLLLRCFLDRIPILISSHCEQEIEFFMNQLVSLIKFRNILIFYTDFIELEDFFNIKENEEMDIETQRNIFLCYPFALEKAIYLFNSFKSWIIGCPNDKPNQILYNTVHDTLYLKEECFLTVQITKKGLITQLEGKIFPNFDLRFENWIIENAIKNTEISIEKMKRVISKRIKSKKIDNRNYQSIMDFTIEEQELKENIIQKEIQNFYEACKRTFNILNRIKLLKSFGIQAKISSKTLFATIAYKQSSMNRILNFIEAEWNTYYQSFLESKKVSDFTDTFESLWG